MIGFAEKKGAFVYIYDEKGHRTGTIGVGTDAILLGFNGSTVSVKKAAFTYIYDEKGHRIACRG